jgi:hypothetical protein
LLEDKLRKKVDYTGAYKALLIVAVEGITVNIFLARW